jgi:hypothetical protein
MTYRYSVRYHGSPQSIPHHYYNSLLLLLGFKIRRGRIPFRDISVSNNNNNNNEKRKEEREMNKSEEKGDDESNLVVFYRVRGGMCIYTCKEREWRNLYLFLRAREICLSI